jgi:hypothetical protein
MFDGVAELAAIGLIAIGVCLVGLVVAVPLFIWWAVSHMSVAIH